MGGLLRCLINSSRACCCSLSQETGVFEGDRPSFPEVLSRFYIGLAILAKFLMYLR